MAKKMTGIVAQFGTKGYGFITGDDGEKYFVHQKNVYNKSRLRTDTRVKYRVETSEKGLVAVDVKLEKLTEETKPLTDNTIKRMFFILLFIQLITVYYVFLDK
ncbi:MAG: cold shock domain-containing protein [Candidatus Thioglobus autotrophicus]|jgi:CspA family cold shock protein|nr:cold shock domain-containing protein [Candidatus Thioglobus autotrophicus]